MGLFCLFGLHDWHGCVCRKKGCNGKRDNNHNWIEDGDSCKCSRCGIRKSHDWIENTEFYNTYKNDKYWIRNTAFFNDCKCNRCGARRSHDWIEDDETCKCSRCGAAGIHDWIRGGETCKCSICGAKRPHDWDKKSSCNRCGQDKHERIQFKSRNAIFQETVYYKEQKTRREFDDETGYGKQWEDLDGVDHAKGNRKMITFDNFGEWNYEREDDD